jgi:hypothetical protein
MDVGMAKARGMATEKVRGAGSLEMESLRAVLWEAGSSELEAALPQ